MGGIIGGGVHILYDKSDEDIAHWVRLGLSQADEYMDLGDKVVKTRYGIASLIDDEVKRRLGTRHGGSQER